MPIRFTRGFSLYTFFSVFLPGLAFLIGVVPLLPYLSDAYPLLFENLSDSLLGEFIQIFGLITLLTFALFVGFAIHTLGALAEKLISTPRVFGSRRIKYMGRPHRNLFVEYVRAGIESTEEETIDEGDDYVGFPRSLPAETFVSVADTVFPYLTLREPGPGRRNGWVVQSETDDRSWTAGSHIGNRAETLYILVRGAVHMDRTGRSRTFQAVFASCRSMFVVFGALTFLYVTFSAIHAYPMELPQSSDGVGKLILREIISGEEAGALRLLVSSLGVGLLGMAGLARVSYHLKMHYLEYLISDFFILHADEAVDHHHRQEMECQPRIRKADVNRKRQVRNSSR